MTHHDQPTPDKADGRRRAVPRRWLRRRFGRGDAGFGSLEVVILTPVFIAMLLLVVGFGRLTHGRQLVEQAASAAARAASLDSTPTQATTDAQREARDILTQAGVNCHTFTADVDTSDFRAGGQVRVTVACVTSLADLGLVGFPGAKTLEARATSPLEQFRQIGLGFGITDGPSDANRSAGVPHESV